MNTESPVQKHFNPPDYSGQIADYDKWIAAAGPTCKLGIFYRKEAGKLQEAQRAFTAYNEIKTSYSQELADQMSVILGASKKLGDEAENHTLALVEKTLAEVKKEAKEPEAGDLRLRFVLAGLIDEFEPRRVEDLYDPSKRIGPYHRDLDYRFQNAIVEIIDPENNSNISFFKFRDRLTQPLAVPVVERFLAAHNLRLEDVFPGISPDEIKAHGDVAGGGMELRLHWATSSYDYWDPTKDNRAANFSINLKTDPDFLPLETDVKDAHWIIGISNGNAARRLPDLEIAGKGAERPTNVIINGNYRINFSDWSWEKIVSIEELNFPGLPAQLKVFCNSRYPEAAWQDYPPTNIDLTWEGTDREKIVSIARQSLSKDGIDTDQLMALGKDGLTSAKAIVTNPPYKQ